MADLAPFVVGFAVAYLAWRLLRWHRRPRVHVARGPVLDRHAALWGLERTRVPVSFLGLQWTRRERDRELRARILRRICEPPWTGAHREERALFWLLDRRRSANPHSRP